MASQPPSKEQPIVIVGAGVFGLSTALHLARREYTNVTVVDKQPYEKTLYSYLDGCDSASADINKSIRSAYGSQTEYQALSTEALAAWDVWNAEIQAGGDAVPPGMTSRDVVWIRNGHLTSSDSETLPEFERATVENMEAAGHHGSQLITNDPDHLSLAAAKGMKSAMQPFSKNVLGVLDTTGGLAVADKACRFALHKAKNLGVRFVLDPVLGSFVSFVHDDSGAKVTGIKTADGEIHPASVTILACGAWTPSLLPQFDGLIEATGGSVALLKIPQDSPLRQRFDPSVFPSWSFNLRYGAEGGIYGFPVDETGILKIGYRGTKYTNPKTQADGHERSVPVTRWSDGNDGKDKLTQIPEQAHKVICKFLDEYLPELGEEGIGIWMTRMCWYTDSLDNHYVIDRVPGKEGLMCATGGSGHAFKFLPNIGNWVVDVLEGVGTDRPAIKAWKWRSKKGNEEPMNTLMEGIKGSRALCNVRLVSAGALSV